jgi:predicted nucleotidyltransferase
LAHALEKLLGRNVDLVAEKTLQNPYLIQSIEKSKIRLV